MLTKNALGNMQNRYSAVLKKCRLLNVFGSLAMVTMLSLGGLVGDACAKDIDTLENITSKQTYKNSVTVKTGGTLAVETGGKVTANKATMVNAGGVIAINGGTYTAKGATKVNGKTVDNRGIIQVYEGTYTAKTATTVNGGSINIGLDGTYNAGGKTTVGKLGAIIVGGVYNAVGKTIEITTGGEIEVGLGATVITGDDTYAMQMGIDALAAKTLNVTGGSYITNGATSVSGTGADNRGTIFVSEGTYKADGATTIDAYGVIEVIGTGKYSTLSTEVRSDGVILAREGGTYDARGITTVNGGKITVAGGTYTAGDTTTVSSGSISVAGGSVDPVTGESLTGTYSATAVMLSGTGSIEVSGHGVFASTTTELSGGSISVNTDGTYGATGTTTVNDGTIKVSGAYNATGTTTVDGGSIKVTGGTYNATGTTIVSSGSIAVSGGTYTATGATTVDGGEINVNSGFYTANAETIVSKGSINVSDLGTYMASGNTSVSNGTINVSDGGYYAMNTSISSGGLINVTGGMYSDNSTTEVGGTEGAVGRITVSGSGLYKVLTTTVNAFGSINVTGGMYTTLGATTVNGGSIDVTGGVYKAQDITTVNGDGVISVSGSGAYNAVGHTIEVLAGGKVSVTGYTVVTGDTSYDVVALADNLGVSDLNIAGGTYETTKTTMVTNNGIVNVYDGTYNATGATTVIDNSTINVFGGTYNSAGETRVEDNSAVNVSGGVYTTGDTVITGTGSSINVSGSGKYISTKATQVISTLNVSDEGTYVAEQGTAIEGGTINVKGGTYVAKGETVLAPAGSVAISDGGVYNAVGKTRISDTGSSPLALSVSSGIYNVGSDNAEWVNTAMKGAELSASGLGILAIYQPNLFEGEGSRTCNIGVESSSYGVNFGDASLLVVHAENLGTNYALTSPTIGTAAGAKLLISNVVFDEEGKATVNVADASEANGLKLADGSWGCGDTAKTGEEAVIDSDTLYFDNALIAAESYLFDEAEGTYTITLGQKSAVDYAGVGMDPKLVAMIDEANANGTLPETLEKLSKELSPEDFAKVTEGLSKIHVSAGVVGATGNISNLATGNTTNRMSFLTVPSEGSAVEQVSRDVLLADNGILTDAPNPVIADAGTEGGLANGLAIWVQPMYQSVSADGFSSGNFNYGYDTDIYGASLGADYTVENSFRYGLAVHVGGGQSESNNSDFSHTENDFDFFGATLYAGYVQNNLSLSGDINYTVTRNELSQEAGAYGASTDVFDGTTLSVGARAEYKIATDIVDIIPYLGARLNYFQTDSFDTKDAAQTVFHTSESYATTFAVPVGVAFSKSFAIDEVELIPRASLGVQFTMGDLDVAQRTAIAGGSAQTMESEVFDGVTFMGGLGLDAKFDNVTLGIDYNLGASENVMSHQISAMLRYAF